MEKDQELRHKKEQRENYWSGKKIIRVSRRLLSMYLAFLLSEQVWNLVYVGRRQSDQHVALGTVSLLNA